MAAAATQAFAAEPRSAWYVQGGVAEDAQSQTVGMSRDWRWEKQYRYGHISGQWQGEVARWHSDSRTSTQLGVTPALRWRPNGWDNGWFVEGGIGVNVIFPKYDTRKKEFSTTFNFGDHIAIGKRFGDDQQHEWSLRFQHFSNGRGDRKSNRMSTSIAHVWGVSGMHTGDCWVDFSKPVARDFSV